MRKQTYSARKTYPLCDGVRFGTLIAEYSANRQRPAAALPLNADEVPGPNGVAPPETYRVTCKLRISLPNKNPAELKPGHVSQYTDYPVILSNAVLIAPAATGNGSGTMNIVLTDYAPRSLNSAVNTERYDTASKDTGMDRTHVTGISSGTSNTETLSLLPISFSWSHTTTDETSSSDSTGETDERGSQQGASDSMSIKDWANYTQVDSSYSKLAWIWAQDYPWNCLQFSDTDHLPQFIIRRMWDGANLFPPSNLSQYGVDFVAVCSWDVEAGDAVPMLEFTHEVDYVTASHKADGGKFTASLNQSSRLPLSLPSGPVDIEILALAAVGARASAVSLLHDRFRIPPAPGQSFAIRSRANNLLVRGNGFAKPMSADLTAGPVTFQILFKVTGQRSYRLVFKHWRQGKDPCVMTITMPDGTVLAKSVDDPEFEGGESNYLRIELRNNSYASTNYHDYLVEGLNVIRVTVDKPSGSTDCSYALSALAIA